MADRFRTLTLLDAAGWGDWPQPRITPRTCPVPRLYIPAPRGRAMRRVRPATTRRVRQPRVWCDNTGPRLAERIRPYVARSERRVG